MGAAFKDIRNVIGGAFVLIGIYLFIYNGDKTVKVLNSLGGQSVGAIKVLQGR